MPISPMLEELPDDVLAEDAGLVHLADVRADLLARELAHGGLEELLFFAQRGERLRAPFPMLSRAAWHTAVYPTLASSRHCPPLRFRHAGVRHVAVDMC